MERTIVSHARDDPDAVLAALSARLEGLTPELRKAAVWLIENPREIGVASVRGAAAAAGVKPNTLVRLARHLGFEGWEELRAPFREQARRDPHDFPSRARWLQEMAGQGALGALYAEMAASAIRNIERSFAAADHGRLKAAADAIVAARRTYVLGVGVNSTVAHNFSYLAGQAIEGVEAIPRAGSNAADDLARAGPGDVLVAMTAKPFRREVVEAVALARGQGLTIIALSDSPASPIVAGADHAFVVSVETPQFFPSSVPLLALLETLMAFVVADAEPAAIASIERFHARRHALGLYVDDPA